MNLSLLDRWHLRRARDPHPFVSRERKPLTLLGALRLFAFLGGSAFILASAGYSILWMVMPDGWVFGGLYRMFLYHWQYPFQYIGLMSFCYALVGSTVILLSADAFRRWPRLTTLLIVILSIAIASPAGGVLWAIHDMQAGYFPEGERFWDAIEWASQQGIFCGWLVILLSFPYNLLGIFLGHVVTRFGYEMTLTTPPRPGDFPTLAQCKVSLPAKEW